MFASGATYEGSFLSGKFDGRHMYLSYLCRRSCSLIEHVDLSAALLQGKERTHGLMGAHTSADGEKTKCMERFVFHRLTL